jgi:ribosomal RNA-processing protein 36
MRRDPRFDSLSGNFNEELFNKSYSFLDDLKQGEMKEMRKELKKTTDPKEKEKLRKALGIMVMVLILLLTTSRKIGNKPKRRKKKPKKSKEN